MTLDEAKALQPGTILHHTFYKNADGTPERWHVNGKVKTWKTVPSRVRIPIKYGLNCYDYLTERSLTLYDLPK